MAPLESDLRNKLERTVVEARRVAEAGARAALEANAVGHHEMFGHMTPEQRKQRTHLRARARQLGDQQDKSGRLELTHIAHECAYEHWHRMLFARFLAENGLLIEPETGVAISLDECKELAKDAGTDLWTLAGRYAQGMLPQIFRPDDPLLQINLAKEHQLELEEKLDALPAQVFIASDSLGWCYQFWQAEEKDRVNKSGNKIGADELPAVTQLFTEDYIVDFLLDNTLGAWWAGKQLPVISKQLSGAKTEEDCRRLVALPGCPWKYLRFVKHEKAGWQPAAGTFEGWPRTAKELKCLDPCCGSGHFIVAMFERLVAVRMAEEGLKAALVCDGVIRENLFGLEIDDRCTQIAAFALALSAWRYPNAGGYRPLPPVNIACTGLSVGGTKEQWLKMLADNGTPSLRFFFGQLYDLFKQAPTLGSLINPTRFLGSGMVDEKAMGSLLTALTDVLTSDPLARPDEHEMGVTAQGVAHAAQFLAGQYSLVTTNVPYLTRGKHDELLKQHIETYYPLGKADLATAFILRCLEFCRKCGTTALITPHNWLFLGSYKTLREMLLRNQQWDFVVKLGEGGFRSSQAAGAFTAMSSLTRQVPSDGHAFAGIDASTVREPSEKAAIAESGELEIVQQLGQFGNPDTRVSFEPPQQVSRLFDHCSSFLGLGTGDFAHYGRCHWEFPCLCEGWSYLQGTVEEPTPWGGREHVVAFDKSIGRVRGMTSAEREQIHNQDQSGQQAWGKRGVAVGLMRELKPTLYGGEPYDKALAVLIPVHESLLPAVWTFCSSPEFNRLVRQLDHNIIVANATLVKVPFDVAHWKQVAAEEYPEGLPERHSDDPTQWIFKGTIADSISPLQVAVALMVSYGWPEQDKQEFRRLEADIDEDGIVCIPSVRGEEPAVERLRRLLAKAYGKQWTPTKERELIVATGSSASDLDEWLRNDFFQQHCELFHQRPFIWHLWDGRKRDGFHVLVNYHKIADGTSGRKLLEKLAHAYLNDWIARQRDGVKHGEGGAEERLAASEDLKARLEAIITGEPPFDIFVRWKPLHQQPIGWEPDINDGVRLNIRPFLASDIAGGKKGAGILRWKPSIKWDKDRGKECKRPIREFPWCWGWDGSKKDYAGDPTAEFTGERWNDCHYTIKFKQEARQNAGRQ